MTLAFGDKLAGGDIFEVRRKEQHLSPGGLVDSVLTRPRRPPGLGSRGTIAGRLQPAAVSRSRARRSSNAGVERSAWDRQDRPLEAQIVLRRPGRVRLRRA